MKPILNVKTKTFNLIKVVSTYNICSEIKSRQAKKKTILSFSTKNVWFFSDFSLPFHQVILEHSISCASLIDKANESCKSSKTFERNTLSTKNLFRVPEINSSHLSNKKQKERKIKLGPLQDETSKHLCPLALI